VFDSRQGQEVFLYFTACRPAPGSNQLPIQWAPGVKWPGGEYNHSAAPRADVKKDGSLSLGLICVHGTRLC
jgi:hypothetical protein